MRLSPVRHARRGFTLLEVLLASVIAILLLGGLYFAMDMTLRQTQEARDGVEIDNLSRGVYNRMTLDLACTLGPLPPKSGGNANSSTPAAVDPATGMPVTDPAAATTDPAAAAATTVDPVTGETVAADPTATAAAADVSLNAGLIGTDKQFSVFVARTPDMAAFDPNVQGRADQRRITYWLSANGGLCRQERPWVMAEGIRNSVDPDLTNGEDGDVIASEVKDVSFEYFDGSSWTGSWDGTILGPDGVTPQGPPRAVKATLTLEFAPARPGQPPITRTVSHVIPIRAAPGTYTPPLIDPYTEGATTTDPATGATTDPATGTSTGTGTTTGSGTTTAPAATTPATTSAPASSGTTTKGGR
jgi:prepilin-type N-terminal cleavage/methylation domain-containing protein